MFANYISWKSKISREKNSNFSKNIKNQIIQKVKDHMKSKEYSAETFEKFSLQGTPSTILVDRKGILMDISFGQSGHVEAMIQKLLDED